MKNSQAARSRRAALAKRNASPRQRAEMERRKRMGVGLIEKPLQLIAACTDTYEVRNGDKVLVESHATKEARIAARHGHGAFVRSQAFNYMLAS